MYRFNRLPDTATLVDMWHGFFPEVHVQDFHEHLKATFGFKEVIATSSGRQALALALAMIPPTQKEIIVPAYGCPIVPLTIQSVGKTPVYVDIQPNSYVPSSSDLANAITAKTGAVILIHEFGNLVPRVTSDSLKKVFDGLIIEDCAVASGSRYMDGARPGQQGDVAVFSGSLGKPLGAFRWGALGINGKQQVSTHSSDRIRRTTVPWLKMLAYKALQQPLIYTALQPFLNQLAEDDSVGVDVNQQSPTLWDQQVVASRYANLDVWGQKQASLANDMSDLLKLYDYEPIETGQDRAALTRVPFSVKSDVSALQNHLRSYGIESGRPFQRNLSGATEQRFPNAYYAQNQTLSLTVKQSNSHRYLEVLERALSTFNRKVS